jgi:hypothetical protein
MKKLILITVVLGYSLFSYPLFSQNNRTYAPLGMAGDDLNLYGVLSIFQQSETLEAFEQQLNVEDSKINNLDLDGDGKTDYIKVIDHVNGNFHAIVLQDVINATESQDVAVIEVDRDKNNNVRIQIIGDEQLYGKDYIIEPINGTPNPGYSGNNTTVVNNNYRNRDRYLYSPSGWRIIRFIFEPTYVVYVSPWRWGYYPTYWRSWHQCNYYDYHGYWRKHHSHNYFHQTNTYIIPTANTYYGPRRSSSIVVQQRNERGDFKKAEKRSEVNTKAVEIQNRNNNNFNNRNNQSTPERRNAANENFTKPERRNPVNNINSNSKRERSVENFNKPNRSERINRKTDNVKAVEKRTENRSAGKAKQEATERRR